VSGERAAPGPTFWLLLVLLVGALVIVAFLVGRSSVTPVAAGGNDGKDGSGAVVENPHIAAAAKELLDNAVRSPGGNWTPELDENFHTLSSRLPIKKRFELGLQLVNLLNQHKLRRVEPPDDCTAVPFKCGGATNQNQGAGIQQPQKKAQ
jgi:hypothetical protein